MRANDGGPLVFHPLPTPTRAEVAEVARRTAERIEKILRAHGRSLNPEMQDDVPPRLVLDQPGLAACYAAAASGLSVTAERAGQPALRLLVAREPPPLTEDDAVDEPVAEVRGVNLHAKQLVDGRDRRQLERLCKYITRPPVAQDRLELRPDGRLELALKSVWRDGTRALILEPQDLLVRLVAAVPPPRFHLLRYFGVLSSHSALRSELVPRPPPDPTMCRPPPAQGDQMQLFGTDHDQPPRRKRWAWLLRHVWQADLDCCPRCWAPVADSRSESGAHGTGPMRWLEAATTAQAAGRLLAKLGLASEPPPPPHPAPRGQLELPFRAGTRLI